MTLIRVGVVGVGYLGTFHAQKYASLPDARLIGVVDARRDRAEAVAQPLGVFATDDYRELLDRVDAVSVVVPTLLHFEIAAFFLSHGVHVLVEKPMTTTVDEAQRLIETAERNGCVLQVGHLERFNPAVMALQELLDRPLFIESHRLAPFKPRGTDVGVVMDLMIHDIDLIQNIVGEPITEVSPIGVPVLTDEEDIANVRLQFANGCVANVTASRVSNKTERKLRVFQPNAYISADLHEKSLTIHRRSSGIQPSGMPNIQVEKRECGSSDALYSQLEAFLQAVRSEIAPVVSGMDGKLALETALWISAGLRRHTSFGQIKNS